MSRRISLPVIPAAFFGMVLGLAGLSTSWRVAHTVWGLPAIVGEILAAIAIVVWAVVAVLYAAKWLAARSDAVTEAFHPVQCCFIGLAGVATMLVAGLLKPYAFGLAATTFILGATWTVAFAVWRTGELWKGGREKAASTPVLYLPTVAGGFVAATIASAFGHPDWGQLALGAATFSWLAIESVIVHRFFTAAEMPVTLRPTMGVQLAPGPVGAVAFISAYPGDPTFFAHALIGYGLLQALVLIRLMSWIREGGFSASFWAFTFGATALSTAPLLLLARGESGMISWIAPVTFAAANVLVVAVAIGTIRLAVQGKLVAKSVSLGKPPLTSIPT